MEGLYIMALINIIIVCSVSRWVGLAAQHPHEAAPSLSWTFTTEF